MEKEEEKWISKLIKIKTKEELLQDLNKTKKLIFEIPTFSILNEMERKELFDGLEERVKNVTILNIKIIRKTKIILTYQIKNKNESIENYYNENLDEISQITDYLKIKTKKNIERILGKSIIFKEENRNEYIHDNCSICLEEFKNKNKIRKLNDCHHIFHQSCIDIWFKNKFQCPTCKNNLFENKIKSFVQFQLSK